MQHVTPLALGKQVGGKPVGWRVREEGGREEGGRKWLHSVTKGGEVATRDVVLVSLPLVTEG